MVYRGEEWLAVGAVQKHLSKFAHSALESLSARFLRWSFKTHGRAPAMCSGWRRAAFSACQSARHGPWSGTGSTSSPETATRRFAQSHRCLWHAIQCVVIYYLLRRTHEERRTHVFIQNRKEPDFPYNVMWTPFPIQRHVLLEVKLRCQGYYLAFMIPKLCQ